jgi:hypothetical protein
MATRIVGSNFVGMTVNTDGSINVGGPHGELIWCRSVGWPTNSGQLRYIDIPALENVAYNDKLILSVRNGSAEAILGVDVGYNKVVRPYIRGSQVSITATSTNATDVLTTATPHNFSVGDRVVFTNGTGDASLDSTLYYYVVNPTGLMTAYVFQVSATPGGAVKTLDSDTDTVVVDYVPSPVLAVPAAIGAADDTFTCTAHHGLTVGDPLSVILAATDNGVASNTTYYVKSTATSKTFTLASAVPDGTVLNVTGTTASIVFKMVEQFFSLTTFTVPVAAAATAYAGPTGLNSKVVEGCPLGYMPCQLRMNAGTDSTYNEFWAYAEILRA